MTNDNGRLEPAGRCAGGLHRFRECGGTTQARIDLDGLALGGVEMGAANDRLLENVASGRRGPVEAVLRERPSDYNQQQPHGER